MIYTVRRLEEFSGWLKGLKDGLTRQHCGDGLAPVCCVDQGSCRYAEEAVSPAARAVAHSPYGQGTEPGVLFLCPT